MSTVGIVGLGLIGGSMAKAIKFHTDHAVYGADLNRDTMSLAFASGAIDNVLDVGSIGDCSLILAALPPRALIDWARENAPRVSPSACVVDLCGVKRLIVDALRPLSEEYGFSYVGGHPMAGKEHGGFKNSTALLFSGASMILTPDERADAPLLEELKKFFLSLGFGSITYSTPAEHDRIISYTSQLCHITSSAFVKSPTAQTHMGFSAGSFRDMTRVAYLDEGMWTQLFMADRDYLTAELDTLINHLCEYRDALGSGDEDRLCELLREGRELKMTAGGT